MKNFRLLMIAVAGCLAFTSCSDDDNDTNMNNGNQNADLTGTYRMTSWNAPMGADFNGDGVSGTNMMTESNCYNNSMMTVNNDGTYTMTYNTMNINSGTSSCGTETTAGTWTRNGNAFATSHMSGGQSMNTNYNFASGTGMGGTTLSRSMNNVQYPSMDMDGNMMYGTGNVNMVMTRQ
jgi:hypothetical protein